MDLLKVYWSAILVLPQMSSGDHKFYETGPVIVLAMKIFFDSRLINEIRALNH